MHRYNLKQFFGWRLLLIMIVFAVALQLIIMVFDWYYEGKAFVFNAAKLIEFLVTYANLLIVSIVIFKLVKWLNGKIMWSVQTAFLRTCIDVVVFSLVTIGWILLENFIIFSLRGEQLPSKQVFFFFAIGTVINLFLVPLIEFIVLMNLQYQTELNSTQLLHENTKFKYEILKNQINPHFLFNSLSILNPLINESPEKSKQYVNSFSNVLRHVLGFREYDSIKLREEIKFLNDYIFLLNIRFEKAFEAKVDISESFADRHILPMVLQLLIENVIKHNKMSDNQPIVVHVKANEKGVEVWNKVRLKSSASSWGIGLENIKMRYASLGYEVDIENDRDIFKINIPYIDKYESDNN